MNVILYALLFVWTIAGMYLAISTFDDVRHSAIPKTYKTYLRELLVYALCGPLAVFGVCLLTCIFFVGEVFENRSWRVVNWVLMGRLQVKQHPPMRVPSGRA